MGGRLTGRIRAPRQSAQFVNRRGLAWPLSTTNPEPNLIHHVMARGNAGVCRSSTTDRDYRCFVALHRRRAGGGSRIRCWNYCLMPNHIPRYCYNTTAPESFERLLAKVERLHTRSGGTNASSSCGTCLSGPIQIPDCSARRLSCFPLPLYRSQSRARQPGVVPRIWELEQLRFDSRIASGAQLCERRLDTGTVRSRRLGDASGSVQGLCVR